MLLLTELGGHLQSGVDRHACSQYPSSVRSGMLTGPIQPGSPTPIHNLNDAKTALLARGTNSDSRLLANTYTQIYKC
jgi:hypothetical protein